MMISLQIFLAIVTATNPDTSSKTTELTTRNAIRYFCSDVMSHSRLDYHVKASYEYAVKPKAIKEGDMTFAKGDRVAFLRFSLTDTRIPGSKTLKSTRKLPTQEILIDQNQAQLRFYVVPKGHSFSAVSVTSNTEATYPDFLTGLLEEALLNWIIDEGPDTLLGPDSIHSFVETHNPRSVEILDKSTKLIFDSRYGQLAVETETSGGTARLKRLSLNKQRDSLEGFSDRCLKDLTDVYQLGGGLPGVDKQNFVIELNYPANLDKNTPFTSMRYIQESQSGNLIGKTTIDIDLKDYHAGLSDDEIRLLRSPISNGTKANSASKELQNLDLCWQDGKIVRRIKGMHLDSNGSLFSSDSIWPSKFLLLNFILLAIVSIWFIYSRRKQKG